MCYCKQATGYLLHTVVAQAPTFFCQTPVGGAGEISSILTSGSTGSLIKTIISSIKEHQPPVTALSLPNVVSVNIMIGRDECTADYNNTAEDKLA